jgi:methyltransferase-like protein/SAM-dependent methyltransferase
MEDLGEFFLHFLPSGSYKERYQRATSVRLLRPGRSAEQCRDDGALGVVEFLVALEGDSVSTIDAVETTTYDAVPYPSYPFAQTHPDRLATIATLFGMTPAPVERCRVLELGCAGGGNLIPMAATLSESRFVGIDRSGKQIADGRSTVDALDLINIDLRHLDLLDLDAELGEFDYIICHGVYSWVPAEVQQKILQICRDLLSPQGVAYVSYNTLPGWNMRGTIRDMMCYHAAKFSAPGERINQSRALLDFLAASVPPENNAYGMLLKNELETIRRASDAYLFHDHLEQENNPCYFHEFMEAAQSHDLQYLGESDVKVMWSGNFGPDIRRTLRGVADGIIEMEQYMDFLRNRMFRQTLLCRSDIEVKRHIGPNSLRGLYIAANLTREGRRHSPDGSQQARRNDAPPQGSTNQVSDHLAKISDLDVRNHEPATFHTVNGTHITTPDPMMKAALVELQSVWPGSIQFESLLETCLARVHANTALDSRRAAQETETLGNDLVKCYVSGLAQFCVSPSRFVTVVSERPESSRLARRQAESGAVVTNLAHALFRLDDLDRHVLRHADGAKDTVALTETLHQLVESGELIIHDQGRRLISGPETRTILARYVADSLPRLASQALLRE